MPAAVSNAPQGIAYLCCLPRLFRDKAESAHELVRKSLVRPDEMTIDAIKAVLDADPQLIEDWRQWSEDKRTSEGWFLSSECDSHVVGLLPDGTRTAFPDAASACADFILKEIRDIGNAGG